MTACCDTINRPILYSVAHWLLTLSPSKGISMLRFMPQLLDVRVFPMKNKSDAHEMLSVLFKRDGVPPKVIMDGPKEQTRANFEKK